MVPISVYLKHSSNFFLLKSMRNEVMMTETVHSSCMDRAIIRKQIKIIRDFRLPPRRRLELPISGLLRSL